MALTRLIYVGVTEPRSGLEPLSKLYKNLVMPLYDQGLFI